MFSYLGGTSRRTSNNLETNFFKSIGATNIGALRAVAGTSFKPANNAQPICGASF